MSSQLDSWVSDPSETHGPLMSVVVWNLFGIATLFLATRLYIQHSQNKLWYDDLILAVSWLFFLASTVLTQLAIDIGYGKHALDIDFSYLDHLTYLCASQLSINLFAITLSKISFGVTLLRLTQGWLKAGVWFAMATLALFMIPATVLPWVQCKPVSKSLIKFLPGECIDQRPSVIYGRFQGVYSANIDMFLALLPWKILWHLQMRSVEKIGVGIAMSFGILAGIAAILRARYLELLATQDVSYDAYSSVIWSQAEPALTIVATSIPVLRVMFRQAYRSATKSFSTSSRSKGSKGSKANPSNPSNNSASFRDASARLGTLRLGRSSMVPTCLENASQKSLVDIQACAQQSYMELDELAVDQKTGRVTVRTPDSSCNGTSPYA